MNQDQNSSERYLPVMFVGRKEELKKFHFLLEEPQKTWLIFLCGEGGIGKTQLLKKMIEETETYRQAGHVVLSPSVDELIDLHWTENRREETLLKTMAYCLGPQYFPHFLDLFEQLGHLDFIPEGEKAVHALEQLRQAFLDDYGNIEADRVVWVFDTAEQAGKQIQLALADILKQMHQRLPATLVLMAGRPAAMDWIEKYFPDLLVLKIEGLTIPEVRKFLEEAQKKLTLLVIPSQENLATIIKKVSGRPIRLALIADWLCEGNDLTDLLEKPEGEFEKLLVEQVALLAYPEDWILLYMALLHRRVNPDILGLVLPNIGKEQIERYLDSLSRFSFVRYHAPLPGQGKSGICFLHDEMQRLIMDYVWPPHDLTRQTRNEALRMVLKNFYLPKIEDLQGQHRVDRNELHTLQIEQLYYMLQLNLNQAFEFYKEVVTKAEMERENGASFISALNEEVRPYASSLSKSQHASWLLNQILVDVYGGRSVQSEDQTELNVDNWDADIITLEGQVLSGVEKIEEQAEARYRLGQLYARSKQSQRLLRLVSSGDEDESGLAGEWYAWFQQKLNEQNIELGARKSILLDFGRLLTTVGQVCRELNKMRRAEKYYLDAISLYQSVENEPTAIAATANARNNLGYVYQRMGRTDEALAQCEAALAVRKRLGYLDQLGYSYNVIGMIRVEQLRPHEAVDNFEQALKCFRTIGLARGEATVLVAYGRLIRQWGEYKQRIAGGHDQSYREDYQRSGEMLRQAIAIFRGQYDRLSLMEAYNEYGTLLRQQEDWRGAHNQYRLSLDLAYGLQNNYRIADNLSDFGILYFRKARSAQMETDDYAKALKYSKDAIEKAKGTKAYYLISKASQTAASIYFYLKEYDTMIEFAADAVTGILRLDPDHFFESAAKRNLEYERVVKWLREDILYQLPDIQLVQQAVDVLTRRWNEEKVNQTGKILANEFPGFIKTMELVLNDYHILHVPGGTQ